ncbi:MAG: YceI family protein [Kitasatospora sp.]|jgi:polyisoprenoid-binding protein YceI|nr:YceI family protein [Kitasatospora sp.]
MTVPAGRHEVGADRDRLVLRTSRDGLAATVGHDLTIEVTRWSGTITVAENSAVTALDVRIDLTSLAVRSGTGGVKPLTDRDKREIVSNARRTLGADRHPAATFTGAKFAPDAGGGGTISGTLTLAGRSAPAELRVTEAGPGRYRATATVVQSDFGIKPYRGFFGALKVSDPVRVEADVDLSPPGGGP